MSETPLLDDQAGPDDQAGTDDQVAHNDQSAGQSQSCAAKSVATALEKGRNRLIVTAFAIVIAFAAVAVKLVEATCFSRHDVAKAERTGDVEVFTGRADIVDRNGQLLATSLATASLFAVPKLVLDAHEAA